jgi:hypothetical protein
MSTMMYAYGLCFSTASIKVIHLTSSTMVAPVPKRRPISLHWSATSTSSTWPNALYYLVCNLPRELPNGTNRCPPLSSALNDLNGVIEKRSNLRQLSVLYRRSSLRSPDCRAVRLAMNDLEPVINWFLLHHRLGHQPGLMINLRSIPCVDWKQNKKRKLQLLLAVNSWWTFQLSLQWQFNGCPGCQVPSLGTGDSLTSCPRGPSQGRPGTWYQYSVPS